MTQIGKEWPVPTIEEFMTDFGIQDLILLLLTAAIIVLCREGKRIFRRRNP